MQSRISQQRTHFLVHFSIQTLEEYMRSGVGYMINSLSNSSDRLIWLRYWTSEVLLAFDFFTKFYYLSKHKATYSEYFYGFERLADNLSPLKSAAILSLYPYIQAKMTQYFNELKMEIQYENMTWYQKAYYLFFPLLHLIVEMIDLIFKFKYLVTKKAQYYDVIFWLLKAKLIYKQAQQGSANNGLLDLLNKPLVLVIFLAYKILTWYYSSRSSQAPSVSSGETPAPFRPEDLSTKGICPLCSKKIVNPAVLSCSGYVFCYGCINQFVKTVKKCPLTSRPCNEQSIHNLYA